jgi:ketosteroid isomerase-like protein
VPLNTAGTGSAGVTEANKELVTRYFDAMERGAVGEATGFWASDATNHATGRAGQPQPRGREALAATFTMLRTAFPDRRYQVDELIAEGDHVVCRMTVSGVFGGTPVRPPTPMPPGWVGVEATELVPASGIGKPYSVKHIHIFRIAGGLITNHWAARDDVGLLLQLGAIAPVHG